MATARERVEAAILKDLRSVKGRITVTRADGTTYTASRPTVAARASKAASDVWEPMVRDLYHMVSKSSLTGSDMERLREIRDALGKG